MKTSLLLCDPKSTFCPAPIQSPKFNMSKFNPIYLTGIVVLSTIAFLCQYSIVHEATSFLAKSQEWTRHVQTQMSFYARQEQEDLSAQEARQTSTLCTDPPPGHCEFYRNCLESKFHCGESGYPLGYGEKFCEKFVAGKDQLSPAGQKWMLGTMQCLQRVLVPDAAVPDSSLGMNAAYTGKRCEALKEKAFNSHSRCYLDNGLCALSVRDWVHIVQIVGIETLFESWDAIKQSIEAGEGCLSRFILFGLRQL